MDPRESSTGISLHYTECWRKPLPPSPTSATSYTNTNFWACWTDMVQCSSFKMDNLQKQLAGFTLPLLTSSSATWKLPTWFTPVYPNYTVAGMFFELHFPQRFLSYFWKGILGRNTWWMPSIASVYTLKSPPVPSFDTTKVVRQPTGLQADTAFCKVVGTMETARTWASCKTTGCFCHACLHYRFERHPGTMTKRIRSQWIILHSWGSKVLFQIHWIVSTIYLPNFPVPLIFP